MRGEPVLGLAACRSLAFYRERIERIPEIHRQGLTSCLPAIRQQSCVCLKSPVIGDLEVLPRQACLPAPILGVSILFRIVCQPFGNNSTSTAQKAVMRYVLNSIAAICDEKAEMPSTSRMS